MNIRHKRPGNGLTSSDFSSGGLEARRLQFIWLFLCVRVGAKFFPAFSFLGRSRNLCMKCFDFAKVVDVFRNTHYYI